ncbi:TetR-like C-terminal domain-containing protein [Microbispora sp. H13382]|uniref:TetR-like C-terminal domain-containing protein n=1 Tax=Microbispora sp. H13382 TaxID=2729112 RepID=UPI001C72051A
MEIYWRHYILPRRQLAAAMLRRAQQDGTVAADADPDVLIDMVASAVTYRVLQPDPTRPECCATSPPSTARPACTRTGGTPDAGPVPEARGRSLSSHHCSKRRHAVRDVRQSAAVHAMS